MYRLETQSAGLVAHGVSTCAGCGLELVIRVTLEVLGENTVIVIPPGCAALFSGYGKETALKIPGFQGNLENTAAIAAAHRIPYTASASVGYINDLKEKVRKAKDVDGPSYLHIHTPCPTGWGFDPSLTIQVAKTAVQTGAWVLMEIENSKPILNRKIGKLKPIKEYLKLQKRFKHLRETDIQHIQEEITHNMQNITDQAFIG